jgi:hypothetical protein
MPALRSSVLGGDLLLARLRADLQRAKSSLVIVGPWLDSFFADLAAQAAARTEVRVVTRPRDTAGDDGWEANRACLDRLAERFPKLETRLLPKLHAKSILIDGALAYLGSANWYRHSLEQARELVVRAEVDALPGCVDEIESIWNSGSPVGVSAAGDRTKPDAAPRPHVDVTVDREALDPLAKHVLSTVSKSFVVGRKGRRS